MKQLTILVTSGGTSEYIDDVRIITNISTGKLGAKIADEFIVAGHKVIYLHGRRSVMPVNAGSEEFGSWYTRSKMLVNIEVASAMDVFNEMEKLVPTVDVVIHAMAVSDFGFRRDKSVKLKSNDPMAFIEYLSENIIVNPKILYHVKRWNPNVKLVSFKFEVGQTNQSLIEIAMESMKNAGSDAVIANDKVEMNNSKEHVAYLVLPSGTTVKLKGKDEIAKELVKFVDGN